MSGRPSDPDRRPHLRRPRRGAGILLGLLGASALVITACGTSGRELRDAAPGATAPARRNSSSTIGNQVLGSGEVVLRPSGYTLSSAAWADGGTIPAQFGCGGADVSPPLAISGVPEGTAELLLVATDVAQPTAPRWIVAGIAPSTTSIDQGATPSGAVEVTNATGSTRWAGPCPDPGNSLTFQLRLYALPQRSGLAQGSGPTSIQPVIATATAAAVLRGIASR